MAAFPAQAYQQCSTRDRVLEFLADRYSEAPIAVGVTNSGGLVEVLTTKDGSTWSILVSAPNGMTCLVASGEGWRDLRLVDERT